MGGNTSVRKNNKTDVIVEKFSSAYTRVRYIYLWVCEKETEKERRREKRGGRRKKQRR